MAEQDYLSPPAKELVAPGQTPCEQAKSLNQQGLSKDAVNTMAYQLPEKDAVKWASASAEKVANPANPADWEALQAAKAWSADPGPATQKAAAEAALKSGHQTPGAWAAQAAAWSGGAGPTPHAVSGAVLLAAAQAGKPIPPTVAGLNQPEIPKLAAELQALTITRCWPFHPGKRRSPSWAQLPGNRCMIRILRQGRGLPVMESVSRED